jgi:LysM repeat protein
VKRHKLLRLQCLAFLGLALVWGLSACSASKNQNPVSGEDVGKVSDDNSFNASTEKPTHYTAKSGDTLRKIAGRPEIYGDPNMWPILQEANAGSIGSGLKVNKGIQLKIPRDISAEQIDEAHEKARQIAAEAKMSSSPPKKPEPTQAPTTAAPGAAPRPTAVPPMPVPQAKKSGVLLPVLFVLLLILAALAVILFFFMKKEGKEE